MAASSSSSSINLARTASKEGIKHLYRTILSQARLLSHTFQDPVIYRSHRFLARKNLDPVVEEQLSDHTSSLPAAELVPEQEDEEFKLAARIEAEDALLGASWPPSTSTKRILRAKVHRRQLSDANQGWEHAVSRALSLAYGRSGKLRRDALTDISPQASNSPSELRYPANLRKRECSPVLQAILTSNCGMDGVPVKSTSHLTDRPPPPFLPALDDPLVKYFERGQSRRRIINASKKFQRTYLRKARVPLDVVGLEALESQNVSLFSHLEEKAGAPMTNRDNSSICSELAEPPSEDAGKLPSASPAGTFVPAYITSARMQAISFSSNMVPSVHRKEALRKQGWSSHPTDYSRPRARRRIYGRLLDEAPLLIVSPPSSSANEASVPSSASAPTSIKNDPLGIRAKLRAVDAYATAQKLSPNKIKLVKSRFAIGPSNQKGKNGERVPINMVVDSTGKLVTREDESILRSQTHFDASEVDFLRQNQLL